VAQPSTNPIVTPNAPVAYGRYQLVQRIGAGGMAEVFRALMMGPEGFQRELVVKRILPNFCDNAEFIQMFINEAKISALLTHPNIVQVYEFGKADDSYFIAMESVNGVTLRAVLTKLREEKSLMPFTIAADIARQVCLGLDYAHSMRSPDGKPLGIIHRDVSPTNIMLAHNGTAKVLDFGIASAEAVVAEDRSRPGVIRGKISYLAPEQIAMDSLDHRVDIFALGAVLYEMLTGGRLFDAKNNVQKMKELLRARTVPPSSLNPAGPR